MAGEEISSRIFPFYTEGDGAEGTDDWIGFGSDKIWKIRPRLEFKTSYDSNVNREPAGQHDPEVILSLVPSLELSRSGTRFGVQGDYHLNYEWYLRNQRRSAFNGQWGTRAWFSGEKFSGKASEAFKRVKVYATSEESERRTVVVNEISPELAYRLGTKFSVASVYSNYIFHYTDSPLRDRSYLSQDFGGRFYYHATSKFDLYLQGLATAVDYYRSSDFDSKGFAIHAGSFGKITDKVTLNIETGFLSRNYDDSSVNSYQNWVWEGVVRYRITTKLAASLESKGNIQESVYQRVGWYAPQNVGLGLRYSATSHIALNLNSHFQFNRYARETSEDSIRKKRNDALIHVGTGIEWYPWRHFTFSVGYHFRQRLSNFDDFDYVDHEVASSAGYHF